MRIFQYFSNIAIATDELSDYRSPLQELLADLRAISTQLSNMTL
jgi:hypothetical protein